MAFSTSAHRMPYMFRQLLVVTIFIWILLRHMYNTCSSNDFKSKSNTLHRSKHGKYVQHYIAHKQNSYPTRLQKAPLHCSCRKVVTCSVVIKAHSSITSNPILEEDEAWQHLNLQLHSKERGILHKHKCVWPLTCLSQQCSMHWLVRLYKTSLSSDADQSEANRLTGAETLMKRVSKYLRASMLRCLSSSLHLSKSLWKK